MRVGKGRGTRGPLFTTALKKAKVKAATNLLPQLRCVWCNMASFSSAYTCHHYASYVSSRTSITCHFTSSSPGVQHTPYAYTCRHLNILYKSSLYINHKTMLSRYPHAVWYCIIAIYYCCENEFEKKHKTRETCKLNSTQTHKERYERQTRKISSSRTCDSSRIIYDMCAS